MISEVLLQSIKFFKDNYQEILKVMIPVILITSVTSDLLLSPLNFDDGSMSDNQSWFFMLLAFIVEANFFALVLGFFIVYLENKTRGLGFTQKQLFAIIIPFLPRMMVLATIATFIIFTGSLFLIVPGIYLAIRLSYSLMLLLLQDFNPIRCISLSFYETKQVLSLIAGSLIGAGIPLLFFSVFMTAFFSSIIPEWLAGYIMTILISFILLFFQTILYNIYSVNLNESKNG